MTESTPHPRRLSAWETIFAGPASPEQIVFDFLFGAAAPVVCLVADPTVFKLGDHHYPTQILFPNLAAFAYIFIALQIAVLIYCLFFKTKNLFLAGWMLAGSLFSLTLGILMLPMTILGLIIFIGIFGFTPFITAFVYFRNAFRILCNIEWNRRILPFCMLALGFGTAVIIPYLTHQSIQQITHLALVQITIGEPADMDSGVQSLRRLGFFFDSDRLVQIHRHTAQSEEKKRIEDAYEKLTGIPFQQRVARWMD